MSAVNLSSQVNASLLNELQQLRQTNNELLKVLEGVVHHNAGTKPAYQLPVSLIRHIKAAIAKAKGGA